MNATRMPRFAGDFKASPDAIINLCRERGDWHGTWGAIPGPGHKAHDRATTIKLAPDHPLGFVVNCFNGDPREAWRYVCGLLGIELARHAQPATPIRPQQPSTTDLQRAAKDRQRLERIVASCRDIHGTPADDYLQSRGLKPPFLRDLRFHPDLWTVDRDGERLRTPGMVGLIRRAPGSRVIGIHRTFLTRDGRKSPYARVVKAMLGEAKGGAVWPDEFGTIIAIGEGIESALAFAHLSAVPCAAALSTSGMLAVRVPSRVTEITLAADHDENGAGKDAATRAARRLWRPLRRVTVLMPEALGDFNDVLVGVARG